MRGGRGIKEGWGEGEKAREEREEGGRRDN